MEMLRQPWEYVEKGTHDPRPKHTWHPAIPHLDTHHWHHSARQPAIPQVDARFHKHVGVFSADQADGDPLCIASLYNKETGSPAWACQAGIA